MYLQHKCLSVSLGVILFLASCSKTSKAPENISESTVNRNNEGMVWIEGGKFIMGAEKEEGYEHEGPSHEVTVSGFWIDVTEVTNAQFKIFVDATKYITTAEKKPVWEELKKQLPAGTPKPEREFQAGSLVFLPPDFAVSLDDYSQWWIWKDGANWRQPEGPGSNLEKRWSHPVVHVSYEDAQAYCKWAGKRLPTEAEWEYASRAKIYDKQYTWGEELINQGRFMANTFQGVFPVKDLGEDGFSGTSPVKTFQPNPFGLYDMIGNVWEWTQDFYHYNYYREISSKGAVKDPTGAAASYDPQEPLAKKYVTKGGSYLCADNYCVNYRSSARQGSSFDSGSSNVGFRCAKN